MNVPASVSATGKRQIRYFPSRRKAEEFASELKASFAAHGGGTSIVPPDIAAEALRAHALLAPYGITITQAAMRAVKEADVVARSLPAGDALDAWLAAGGNLAQATAKSYKATADLLRKKLGDTVLALVDPADIQAALTGKSYSLHRRNASAFWHWSAKAPRRWCDTKVFKDVEEAASNARDKDISVFRPSEVSALLRTAELHFPETVCIYAVRLFGGIRSDEAKKLETKDVHPDGIEISAKIAKKPSRRFIPMNDTLGAWLAVYPFAPCPNWDDKDKAVRRLAGWDVAARLLDDPPAAPRGPWPKNVIRHTHASVEIANGASLEDLLFRFGHNEEPKTLRAHYVGRMRKKDAVEILSLGPKETSVSLIKSA